MQSQNSSTASNIAKAAISLACGMLLTGICYIWNANAEFAVLKRDMSQVKEQNLDARLSTVESNIKTNTNLLNRMDDKIDRLLESRRK